MQEVEKERQFACVSQERWVEGTTRAQSEWGQGEIETWTVFWEQRKACFEGEAWDAVSESTHGESRPGGHSRRILRGPAEASRAGLWFGNTRLWAC